MQAEPIPFPRMLNIQGMRGIPFDHILEVNCSALESHKTLMVNTTSGPFMVHDETAMELAQACGMRPASEAKQGGGETAPPKGKKK